MKNHANRCVRGSGTHDTPPQSQRDGQEFEALVLRLIDERSWFGRARIGGQRTKDALRRSAGTRNLVTIGRTLASLARHSDAGLERVSALFEDLHVWAVSKSRPDPRGLAALSAQEAREDGEADAALIEALTGRPGQVAIESAIRERVEQIAAARRVLAALRRQLVEQASQPTLPPSLRTITYRTRSSR